MIFNELYSAYYNSVTELINEALKDSLEGSEFSQIVGKYAFGESYRIIETEIKSNQWPLIFPDGTTPIKNRTERPPTTLEKRWLKAIYADPRVRLFTDEAPDFSDVTPLFTAEDIVFFDRSSDGDPYENEDYIRNFRLILRAIQDRQPLCIKTQTQSGAAKKITVMPEHLEYSERDDKFRLVGRGEEFEEIINLARIISCTACDTPFEPTRRNQAEEDIRTVEFEIRDERNAPERVLLHFAHFKKQVYKSDENTCRVLLEYDKDDESEILIRILSFGPSVKVTAPENFKELLKDRLKKQKGML